MVRPGLGRVEASLSQLANSDDPLLGPMLSAVLPGTGKRLRPALSLVIGVVFGVIAGYVAGGRGRRLRPVVIPGNRVELQLARDLDWRQAAFHGLTTRHGDGVVEEQLVGDACSGRDGRPDRSCCPDRGRLP